MKLILALLSLTVHSIIISGGQHVHLHQRKDNSSIGSHCLTNHDCMALNDQNMVCFNNHCDCSLNYKFDSVGNKCDHIKCEYNSDCQFRDFNSVCDKNGSCVCSANFKQDINDGKCKSVLVSDKDHIIIIGFLFPFFLLTIFAIGIYFQVNNNYQQNQIYRRIK